MKSIIHLTLAILALLLATAVNSQGWPAVLFNPTNGAIVVPTNLNVNASGSATNLAGNALVQVTNIAAAITPAGALTNGQIGNVQFTNSTVTVSNLTFLGTIAGASIAPSSQSGGNLNINLGSGSLIGSSVNVGAVSGNGSGLTSIPYSALTGTPFIPSTNNLTGSNAPTSAFTGASFTGTHYGNAGPLTNLTADSVVGTLNPTISSNVVAIYNDAPVQTNMLLQPFAIGGMIASAAASSNCAVMDLGDSLTEGANQPSALKIFGQRLRATYGDSGVAGANVPISGWNNNPNVFNRVPPTNVWIRNLIGEIIPSDGTNACYSTLQNGGDYSNVVNQVGLCYVSAPQSSNFAVCIWSPSAGVTNFYKITNDNSASINFYRTNWAVAPAYDWTIGCSSLGGTNYLINSILMNTNHGVQFWTHGYAGYSPAHIASVGSNMWAQIVAAINPRVVIYHGLHLGNSDSSGWWGGTGDTSLQTTTNALWALMGSHSTNTQVVVVGVPPNSGGDQRVVNYYLKLACQSFGWYYLDVWSAFPDYNTEVNAGLFDGANGDYVHPSLAGSYARSGVMWQKMGLAPAAWNGVDLRNASGTISLGSLPSGVLTNNQFGVTLNGTTLGGSYGGVALTGGGVYGFNNGVLIYGGGLEMRYNGGCVNFTQGQNGVNGATFINTLTNNSASVVATNNVSVLNGGAYYGNGAGLTNLQASALVGSGSPPSVINLNTNYFRLDAITGNAQTYQVTVSITNSIPAGIYSWFTISNNAPTLNSYSYVCWCVNSNAAGFFRSYGGVNTGPPSTNGFTFQSDAGSVTAGGVATTNLIFGFHNQP